MKWYVALTLTVAGLGATTACGSDGTVVGEEPPPVTTICERVSGVGHHFVTWVVPCETP